MTIHEMHKRIASLKLPQQLPVLVQKTSSEIISITQRQLYAGFDGTGQKIQPKYRNKSYATRKQQINPLPGFQVPDLKLTGRFYKSIKVLVDADSFYIDSSDSKVDKLETRYGEDILRMSPVNRGIYAKGVFFDALKAYITRKTGLQFR